MDQWGDDVPGFYIDPPPGELSVIRFESEEGDDRLEHRVVSKAESGISPEGIAVSPDGRLVATANLVRSFLPWDDSRLTQYSSMSLFDLNPLSGENQTSGGLSIAGNFAGVACIRSHG